MRVITRSSAKVPARRFLLVALLSTAALTASCADQPVEPEHTREASDESIPEAAPSLDVTQERRALAELTRAVAVALADDATRQRVLADMRASRHTSEHKLELNRYLRKSAPQLLMGMATATQTSQSSILSLLALIRPLEFYMPIREHRESWAGGADVVVASLLDDEDDPVVFDLSGARVDAGPDGVPAAPTLALVPVETDFSTPLSAPNLVNKRSSGTAIGTWTLAARAELEFATEEDCDPRTSKTGCWDTGGGGPSYGYVPADAPTGLYMTWTSLEDHGEHDLRGDPEIEAHVIGPWPNETREDIHQITCAGEGASGLRYFNQDAYGWNHGYVLLLSDDDFRMFRFIDTLPENRQFSVILYEDDQAKCEIRDDPWRVANQLGWLGLTGLTGYKVVKHCERPESSDLRCGLAIWGVVIMAGKVFWNLFFGSNDDYLGLAIEKSRFPEYLNSNANYVLLKPNTVINGGIRLEYHRQAPLLF